MPLARRPRGARGLPALALLLAGLAGSAPPDLDVGIPPGSPLEWSDAFPVTREQRGLLLPRSGGARSRSGERYEPRALGAQGMVRILTWDLAAHLAWVSEGGLGPDPRTGLPAAAPGRRWVSLAPFLRLLLHPGRVPEPEVIAHLVELGPPVLEVLPAVRSERTLRRVADEVQARIVAEPGNPVPLRGESVRGTMLRRFACEELLAAEPFDPEAAFGERLSYFADELLPVLASYADHPAAAVRRGAVSALGRYRGAATVATLARLGRTSADPVVRVRALLAFSRLASPRDGASLVTALEDAQDPVQVVCLAQALGRSRCAEAAPVLVARASAALEKDPEVLPALLTALARLPRLAGGTEPETVLALARKVESKALSTPYSFRPKYGSYAGTDAPDPVTARGRLLAQLAVTVRLRWGAADEETRERFLVVHEIETRRDGIPTGFLDGVEPGARTLFVESLALLGEEGQALLAAAADDERLPPELRVLALRELAWDERAPRLDRILAAPAAPLALHLAVAEMVATDPDPRFEEPFRAWLAVWAAAPSGAASYETRSRALAALRWLEDQGRLRWEDVRPLVHHLRAPQDAHWDLFQELRRRIGEWIEAVLAGTRPDELADEVRETVRSCAAAGLLPVTGEAVEEHVAFVLAQLEGTRQGRERPRFVQLVEDALLEHLAGYAPERPERATGEFFPPVPLEESLLLALARLADPRATEALSGVLRDRGGRHRAVACLAAGLQGRRETVPLLVPYLLDEDPFCRLAAAEALGRFRPEMRDVDWMYGEAATRFAAAEEALSWSLEGR